MAWLPRRGSGWLGCCVVGSIAMLLSCAPGRCDGPRQALTEDANDTGKDTVVAARTEAPPKIDGVLDDACWKDATRLTGFRIADPPGQGLAASQQTEVLVTSDRQALYFAFICYDTEAGRISAHQTQYDGSMSLDDVVDVGLDTFCDKTRSYLFEVNPLGTRRDARWEDARWNARWSAAAKIGTDGWTVEMAIPFSILTMPKGATQFGFNCERGLERKSESSAWKYTKNYSWREFTWATLSGFDTGEARRPDRYLGYVVGSHRFEKPTGTASHAGFDWEHPLSPTANAMLTLNPDWSNVEVAHSGIDFTYVERKLPEVRPFFVESGPYLPTSTLFYPAGRVYSFDEGLKLTGTQGRLRFGVLGMAGLQRFAGDPRENDVAARLWYDFSHETYLNVADVNTPSDNSTCVEFVHEHKGRINTRHNVAWYHQTSDLPDLGGGYSHFSNTFATEDWSADLTYKNYSDNIQPRLSQISRRGISWTTQQLTRYWNPKPESAWFEQASLTLAHDHALDHQGRLSFEESSATFDLRQSPVLSVSLTPDLYRHPGPAGNTFKDLTWNVVANVLERAPMSASTGASLGTIEESRYRYFYLSGVARTRDDRLAFDATLEWTRWARLNALSLHGRDENANQYALGAAYRFGKHTSFAVSQRWLRLGSESTSIFSAILNTHYGVDHDLYIIYGDPRNPNQTVGQILVKYVMPFGKWGGR